VEPRGCVVVASGVVLGVAAGMVFVPLGGVAGVAEPLLMDPFDIEPFGVDPFGVDPLDIAPLDVPFDIAPFDIEPLDIEPLDMPFGIEPVAPVVEPGLLICC